jgi:integrase/recombinase XerD
MANVLKNTTHFPLHFPMNFSGKLTAKIVIKDDYVRADGTCALYLQMFLNKEKKKIPMNISVCPVDFDKLKQRIKSKHPFSHDYNMIIEKAFSDIHKIELSYRLSGSVLDMTKLIKEYENPTSKIDFIKFWELEMKNQKLIKDEATYNQQMSSLRKVKSYKSSILFYEITPSFFDAMLYYFKNVKKNEPYTIQTVTKNFKKYLHIANDIGIITPLNYRDITVKKCVSNRTFLIPEEIFKLYQYYSSEFINPNLKNILARFLFSCFTGLRISDIKAIGPDNIITNILVFFSQKTGKLQRIQLSNSALKFIGTTQLFYGDYTEQHINRELKTIAKSCGITKRITFHVARHSFATNFLICGGRVEVLQKLLAHSQIRETMDYVHIVESISDQQINNLDDILTKKPLN